MIRAPEPIEPASDSRTVDLSVDAVVVQYGRYDLLTTCLSSLENARVRPNRILVIVNGLRGAPVDRIHADHPTVEVTVNTENRGYSGAANQGLRLSTARYVALLNNDLTVDPNWLGPLRDTASRHPEAALVQPKVISARNRESFDYAGAAGGFMDGYGYPCARGRLFATIEKDRGQYDDACELFWASGAALLIDREAAIQVGGFDENFFVFHEESDLAWRLHLRGKTVWFSPDSRVYHVGSAAFLENAATSRLQLYMMHRNDLIMVAKNWGTRELRFRLPVRVLLEFASWPFLAVSYPTEFSEAVRAFLWVVRHPDQIAGMRRTAQAQRTHPDESYAHLMVRGILPLRYYVGRERLFPQLDRYPAPPPPSPPNDSSRIR